jgi:hypothetical protein
MFHPRLILTSTCAAIALLVTACAPLSSITLDFDDVPNVHSSKGHRSGPPPHAPAHGHRHNHRHERGNFDLVFDSNLGVYVVAGMPNLFYSDGYYLRLDGDQWYASVDFNGGWQIRSNDSLPPGMHKQKKHHKHNKHHKAKGGKSKKSSPAKGKW